MLFQFLFYIFCFFNLHLCSQYTHYFPPPPPPPASSSSTTPSLHLSQIAGMCHLCDKGVLFLLVLLLFFLIHYLNTCGPRWWSLVTALSWCHICHSHSPSMAYTSMNTRVDVHSPMRAGRRTFCSFDTAACCRVQSAKPAFSPSSSLYFPNGTFQISVKTPWKPLDHPPHLSLNPIKALSFEIWLTNTASRQDEEGTAFHDDLHIISHKSRNESYTWINVINIEYINNTWDCEYVRWVLFGELCFSCTIVRSVLQSADELMMTTINACTSAIVGLNLVLVLFVFWEEKKIVLMTFCSKIFSNLKHVTVLGSFLSCFHCRARRDICSFFPWVLLDLLNLERCRGGRVVTVAELREVLKAKTGEKENQRGGKGRSYCREWYYSRECPVKQQSVVNKNKQIFKLHKLCVRLFPFHIWPRIYFLEKPFWLLKERLWCCWDLWSHNAAKMKKMHSPTRKLT